MSGEYIVISPIPANLLLRYGKKIAQLWPTHPIYAAPSPNAVAGTMASAPAVQQQPAAVQPAQIQQPAPAAAPPPQQQAPAAQATTSVKLANMAALYSDKLTDTGNEH
jgi:hypothetical protein